MKNLILYTMIYTVRKLYNQSAQWVYFTKESNRLQYDHKH